MFENVKCLCKQFSETNLNIPMQSLAYTIAYVNLVSLNESKQTRNESKVTAAFFTLSLVLGGK